MKSTLRTLGVIIVLFFGLLLLLTSKADKSDFKYSAREMLQLVTNTDYVIDSGYLKEMPGYTLIDLRKPEEFVLGHAKDAINIPVASILDDKHKALFASDAPKVLLAHDPIRAHETWMLLTQLGHGNLWVMEGLEEG